MLPTETMLTIMKTMMNNLFEYNKSNVLICWNPGEYAEKLKSNVEEYGFSVVTSFDEFQEKFKEPEEGKKSKGKKDKRKEQKNQVRTEALVVLCELTWGKSTEDGPVQTSYSATSGIDFVKSLRVTKDKYGHYKYRIPIVFVSFLSRSQQLNRFSKNEIISTPALSHFYNQLPSEPTAWIEELNVAHKKLLNEPLLDNNGPLMSLILEGPSLEDIKSHFCDPVGMLRELRHDLKKKLESNVAEREEKFFNVFKQIEDIVGDLSKPVTDPIKSMSHDTEEKFSKKVDKVYTAIDNLIPLLNNNSLSNKGSSQPTKVVFLDDEFDKDKRLKRLLNKMKENHFEVYPFTDPNEAYTKVESDKENEIDIIISDFRIWNNDEDPRLMDKMQGYTFLKKCADLGRTYTFVIFSALDRNFLMKQIGIHTETLYKNGIFEGEYSMLNFIHNLREWGEANRNSIAGKINDNEVFVKCYNWYRNSVKKAHYERKINELTAPIVAQYKKISTTKRERKIDSFPESCVNIDNELSCDQCGLYKLLGNSNHKIDILDNIQSYYKKRDDWNPLNQGHVDNLLIKFAARRLYLFYYFSLKSIGCRLRKDIIKSLISYGRIYFNLSTVESPNKGDRDEIDKKGLTLNPAKDFWLEERRPVYTPEERKFLENHHII